MQSAPLRTALQTAAPQTCAQQFQHRRRRCAVCCSPSLHRQRCARRTTCKADSKDDRADDSAGDVESQFAKELRLRGMSNTATSQSTQEADRAPPRDARKDAAEPSQTPQLDRSRALNSEGLEGLIPRASLLIRTGASFFLAFWPLILLLAGIFGALIGVYGPEFVHGGTTSTQLPGFVDPYELLAEPPVDPYYPVN